MGRTSRAELSKDNPYYISKERRLELEHFCHQYKEWEKEIKELNYISGLMIKERVQGGKVVNTVEDRALRLASLTRRLQIVNKAIDEAVDCKELRSYIFESVINGYSYKTMRGDLRDPIPSGEKLFKNYRQRFYYILDGLRE